MNVIVIAASLMLATPMTGKEEVKDDKHIYEDVQCLVDANLITIEEAQKIWAKHKSKKNGNREKDNS